jgi:hypothetical protein
LAVVAVVEAQGQGQVVRAVAILVAALVTHTYLYTAGTCLGACLPCKLSTDASMRRRSYGINGKR